MIFTIRPEGNQIDKNLQEKLFAQNLQFYVSKERLAEVLDVSPRTITAWRYRYKDFPALKLGKHVRYSVADVIQWQRHRLEE